MKMKTTRRPSATNPERLPARRPWVTQELKVGRARQLMAAGGEKVGHGSGLGGGSGLGRGWGVLALCGVVVDGCVRDVAELAACATGIRALAAVPLPTVKREEGQRDVPVQVQGTWVRPGDWLYADADGIVVAERALV